MIDTIYSNSYAGGNQRKLNSLRIPKKWGSGGKTGDVLSLNAASHLKPYKVHFHIFISHAVFILLVQDSHYRNFEQKMNRLLLRHPVGILCLVGLNGKTKSSALLAFPTSLLEGTPSMPGIDNPQ